MKKEIALMTPVSKDLLYVKIADAIHGYIRENNLKPGDRLPSERALSQQLGTGRHSVREATPCAGESGNYRSEDGSWNLCCRRNTGQFPVYGVCED